jgi:hypothetical protein
MPNNYEYKVTNLERNAEDIIVAASFTITASDETDSFTHNYYTAFNNKPETPIAYNDLTEEKVIGWIKRDVGASSEESADAELAAFKERKEVQTGTPW